MRAIGGRVAAPALPNVRTPSPGAWSRLLRHRPSVAALVALIVIAVPTALGSGNQRNENVRQKSSAPGEVTRAGYRS